MTMMLNNPLIRPYFLGWGGVALGVPLVSHDDATQLGKMELDLFADGRSRALGELQKFMGNPCVYMYVYI